MSLQTAVCCQYEDNHERIQEPHSPERISEVDADAEVASGLLHAVHANPQLPRVAPTCRECKNGKELHKERKKQSDAKG